MKKVNLQEILDDCAFIDVEIKANVLSAMKEACRQTLELAAENAKAFDTIHSWNIPIVDKQSILDTIKQIEQYEYSKETKTYRP